MFGHLRFSCIRVNCWRNCADSAKLFFTKRIKGLLQSDPWRTFAKADGHNVCVYGDWKSVARIETTKYAILSIVRNNTESTEKLV